MVPESWPARLKYEWFTSRTIVARSVVAVIEMDSALPSSR
jgi:hypothetical protein